MSEDIYNNRLSKFIAAQRPNRLKVDDVAKDKTGRLCDCPGSEPGKIIADISAHLAGCRFRKRSSQYVIKTLAIPNEILDGCRLAVVLGEENL